MKDILNNVFFTSDQHFGHENIIKFCNRPYETVEEMDAELIANWNDMVGINDTVYHLGDFCLGNADMVEGYFSSLHGKIKILRLPWHHDRRWIKPKTTFKTLSGELVEYLLPEHVLEIDIGEKWPITIHLSHYPIGEWDRKHHGSIHLHGHSHGKYTGDNHISDKLCFDVGVDDFGAGYAPVSLHTILEMAEKI